MAWTTPSTVAPGEVYTASRYNTDTVGNLLHLYNTMGYTLVHEEPEFTNVASASQDGVFTSAYANYLVLIHVTTASNADVDFFLRSAGSDLTTNGYAGFALRNRSDGGATAQTNSTARVAFALSSSNAGVAGGLLHILRPAVNGARTMISGTSSFSESNTLNYGCLLSAQTQGTSAYDGMTVKASTGNISGQFWVYGAKG